MVYTTYLWWFGGWFMIVLTTFIRFHGCLDILFPLVDQQRCNPKKDNQQTTISDLCRSTPRNHGKIGTRSETFQGSQNPQSPRRVSVDFPYQSINPSSETPPTGPSWGFGLGLAQGPRPLRKYQQRLLRCATRPENDRLGGLGWPVLDGEQGKAPHRFIEF